MSRSDKGTVIRRVQDVLRLLLAGAEFAEIRQFASAQDWNVTDRQIRRYQEAAYRRVAKIARRDRLQLLGRHLMQRRMLYAHAIKDRDFHLALKILRDEAELQGLYPCANRDQSVNINLQQIPWDQFACLSDQQVLEVQAKRVAENVESNHEE